jgi:hypothetical protein
MNNKVSRLLDAGHLPVLACCVMLNVWLVASATPAAERVVDWLALAVPRYLAVN